LHATTSVGLTRRVAAARLAAACFQPRAEKGSHVSCSLKAVRPLAFRSQESGVRSGSSSTSLLFENPARVPAVQAASVRYSMSSGTSATSFSVAFGFELQGLLKVADGFFQLTQIAQGKFQVVVS